MPVVAAVIGAVLWAGELLAIRLMQQEHGVSPVVALVCFYGGGVIPLTAWALLTGKFQLGVLRRAWPWFAAIGLVAIACNFTGFVGLGLTSAGETSVLYRSDVLFALLLGYLFLRERIRLRETPFVAVMALGVGLLVGLDPAALDPRQAANLLVVLSAFLLSVNALLIKVTARQAPTEMIASVNWLVGSAFFVTFAIARGEQIGTLVEPPVLWLSLVLVGSLVVALNCYYYALKHLELWRARIIMFLTPAIIIILERIFLAEKLGGTKLAGVLLTLAGAAGIAFARSTRREARNGTLAAAEKASGP